MTGGGTHVAHFNRAILRDDWGSPAVAGFEDNIDRVNALAARSPGFVWRMPDEAMEREQFDPRGVLGADPRLAATLSVWESVEALETFVHKTVHGAFLRRRDTWFVKQEGPTYVIWPVPVGHRPTIAEAVERLNLLGVKGPTDLAFDFNGPRNVAAPVGAV